MFIEETKKKFILNVAFWGAVVLIIYVVFKILPLLFPFILGYFIAVLSRPSTIRLHDKMHLNEKLAAFLSVTFYIVFIISIVFLAFAILIRELSGLSELIPDVFENLPDAIDGIRDKIYSYTQSVSPKLAEYVDNFEQEIIAVPQKIVMSLMNFVYSVVSSIPTIVVNTIIIIVSAYFISMDYTSIRSFISRSLPQSSREIVYDSKRIAQRSIGKILRGYLILMFISFVELCIAFYLFQIPYATTLAMIIAVVDILPVLGVGTVLIPWSVISFVSGNSILGAELLILYIIISLTRPALEAKIVGSGTGVHPLIMLISLYIGLKLFGIIGMFGLPIAMIVAKNLYILRKDKTSDFAI